MQGTMPPSWQAQKVQGRLGKLAGECHTHRVGNAREVGAASSDPTMHARTHTGLLGVL